MAARGYFEVPATVSRATRPQRQRSWSVDGRLLGPAALLIAALSYPSAVLSEDDSPDIEVYGRANVSVDYYHGGDEYSAFDLASNSSRIGIQAEHTLDTGLKLLGEVEQWIDFNRGSGADWASRSALLGLEDEWGTIKLGYMNTVLKDLRGDTDLFSGQMGDTRNVLRGPHNPHLDGRMRSGIRYISPEQQGWGVELQYSFDTEDRDSDEETPADDNDFNSYSALLRYVGERFWLALGHERYYGSEGDTLDDRRSGEGYRLGVKLEASENLTLYALAQITQDSFPYFDNNNDDPEGYVDALGGGLGVKYNLAEDLELRGQYYAIDADRSGYGARMGALGIVFHADERTRLYTTFANINNESNSCLAPWVHGRTAGPDREVMEDVSPAARGCTTWALSSGVRFDF
ncbi:porin [Halorhodospira halochloris]|uniref:porin n=1 Tax=Halorhodospira halochloris TaxID=1052 RepID=UPI001EE98677|nr:porin [Halorhodospira halochloris]MCG5530649.1 porin [Halorhodospira halochloris]